MGGKFKVLSLSGGGVRGIYTAAFLAELEELTGKKIAEHFDLIVGTSTGGLIALAIGLGQSVASIRDFYLERATTLFPKAVVKRRWYGPKRLLYPKLDSETLKAELQKRLGSETLLGHSKVPLVIPSFHAPDGQPVCFKTRHHADFRRDHTKKAWEVAMATSAAPTYYRAFEASDGCHYIDGGVWANCPVLIGVIEAIDRFDQPRDQIDVLSLGTTRAPFQHSFAARQGGLYANRSIHELFMEANRGAHVFMAQRLVGASSILEVDRVVQSAFGMDDSSPSITGELRALGTQDAKSHANAIDGRFFGSRAKLWGPVA